VKALALIAVFLACATSAFAHDPGLSSLDVTVGDREIVARMSIALGDAEALGAGRVLVIEGARGVLEPRDERDDRDASDNYRTLTFDRSAGDAVTIRSTVFEKLSPHHRQFVSVKDAQGAILVEKMLSAESPSIRVEAAATPLRSETFGGFFKLGIGHIVTGYDHLLFLFSLLLVSTSLRRTFWTISAFTVAHSVTLALATLNIVQVPSRIVEPVIAATIIYVALENIFSTSCERYRAPLTFALGLVHGLGFAGVLREMGIAVSGASVATPLIAFNLGVETGQVGIALIVVPLLMAFRRHPAFAARWVPACSALAAALGAYWFASRLLG
jgi:hydrogenase/urease accessory protein HupE